MTGTWDKTTALSGRSYCSLHNHDSKQRKRKSSLHHHDSKQQRNAEKRDLYSQPCPSIPTRRPRLIQSRLASAHFSLESGCAYASLASGSYCSIHSGNMQIVLDCRTPRAQRTSGREAVLVIVQFECAGLVCELEERQRAKLPFADVPSPDCTTSPSHELSRLAS